jgi:hypothetical protein
MCRRAIRESVQRKHTMPHPQDDESDFVHTTCPSLEASRTTCLTEKHGQSRRSPSTQEGRRGPSGSTRNYKYAHHCCPCICCLRPSHVGYPRGRGGTSEWQVRIQLYLAMTTERLSTDPGREHWCDGEPGRQPLAADGRLRKAGPLCSGLDNCYCCCCLPSRLPAQTSSTSYRLLSFQPTAHHSPIGSCQTDQTCHSSINLINPIK